MSFWGRLFGSSDVIKQAADGIYNGVDKAWYTDEEKAEGFLALLQAYEPFKLAQRLLMLTMCVPFAVAFLLSILMVIVSPFVGNALGKEMEEAARLALELMGDVIGTPVAIIVGFYFGGGAVEGIVAKMKGTKK